MKSKTSKSLDDALALQEKESLCSHRYFRLEVLVLYNPLS